MLLSQFPLMDIATVLSVLETANAVLLELRREPVYDLHLGGWSWRHVLSSSGVPLAVRAAPQRLDAQKTHVILAGGPGMAGEARNQECADALAWLQQQLAQGVGLFTIGREAHTLVERATCPRPAGAGKSGAAARRSVSVTQGAELALGLVLDDLGETIAGTVAHRMSAPYHRPPGEHAHGASAGHTHADIRIADLHRWIAQHLRQPLTVAYLAEHIGMSERTFMRFYRRATGLSAGATVTRIRLDEAKRLLSSTGRPIKQVADLCGFSSSEVLRRAFVRHFRMSPQQYRSLHTACDASHLR